MGGNCEKGKEREAFVSPFLTVGIGNSQMLSITSEGQRIDCPIYLMKRSRGGGVGGKWGIAKTVTMPYPKNSFQRRKINHSMAW